MAQGDVVAGLSSLTATTGTLDIRPATNVEWSIHNVYWSQGTIELYKTDGTNYLRFENDGTQGGRLGASFNLTNAQWLHVKNLAGTATLVGYDGKQTK